MQTAVVLRPGRLKWACVGLLFVLLAAIGVWLAASGSMLGWGLAIFFGLGVLVSVAMQLPGGSYLRLTDEGFTMCTLYRPCTYRWEEVSAFEVGRVLNNRMVLFDLEGAHRPAAGLRSMNRRLAGREAALPDNYGLSLEALADLMNRFKASHDSRGGAGAG